MHLRNAIKLNQLSFLKVHGRYILTLYSFIFVKQTLLKAWPLQCGQPNNTDMVPIAKPSATFWILQQCSSELVPLVVTLKHLTPF